MERHVALEAAQQRVGVDDALIDGEPELLTRVDLDLQAHLEQRVVLRGEPVHEVDPTLLDLAARRAEPWVQHLSDEVEGLADGFRPPSWLHLPSTAHAALRWS